MIWSCCQLTDISALTLRSFCWKGRFSRTCEYLWILHYSKKIQSDSIVGTILPQFNLNPHYLLKPWVLSHLDRSALSRNRSFVPKQYASFWADLCSHCMILNWVTVLGQEQTQFEVNCILNVLNRINWLKCMIVYKNGLNYLDHSLYETAL